MIENVLTYPLRLKKQFRATAWFAVACVSFILYLTLLPNQNTWTESEKTLCYAVPAITAVAGATGIAKGLRLKFTGLDIMILGWYVYSIIRIIVTPDFPVASFMVKATLLETLYIALRLLFSFTRINSVTIAVLLICTAFVESFMGFSQIVHGTSRHPLYPVTGSFLNPGPYSAFPAMGFVLLCALYKTFTHHRFAFTLKFLNIHTQKENILLVMSLVLIIPLAMTVSRAAILSVSICLAIIYRKKIKNVKLLLILALASVTIAVIFYFLKAGSADGRLLINYIGMKCITDSPIFGSGIGSFFHHFALKTASISHVGSTVSLSRVDVMDYAFNDLLRVFVEQGIIGFIFAMGIIFLSLNRLWSGRSQLFYAMLFLLIFSLFSYPFEQLPFQIIGVTILAWAASSCTTKEVLPGDKMALFKGIMLMAAFLTATSLLSHYCLNEIKKHINAEREYAMMSGLSSSVLIKDYYPLLPDLQDNKYFLFDFAKLLSDAGRHNDSNDMLRRGALISNDPMFLVLQGNNYREMGAIGEAEAMYLLAWHSMPNRIYPFYRLMMLHGQAGNRLKMLEYAKKIVEFKEKVSSRAVSDMKREAMEIISQNKSTK